MDRMNNDKKQTGNDTDTGNSAGYDRNTERGDHTEIDQPNPSIATPGIPDEMPVREIR
jgi:hypothetical protein